MKRIVAIFGLLFLSWGLFAQGTRQGHLVIHQDPMLDSLNFKYYILRSQVQLVEDNKGIPGYRIQVFFDSGINSGERARKAREDFAFLFPDIPGYVTWKAPNYRVRVGDFRSRLEAERALQLIMVEYPNAWVITDEINYPPIF
jgi:hypothetical protein